MHRSRGDSRAGPAWDGAPGEASRRSTSGVSGTGDDAAPTFAELLRRHREAAGLSQEALAERAGLSPGGIGALERGIRRAPQRQTVTLLADALGLSEADRARLETAVERRRGPATARLGGSGGAGAPAPPLAAVPAGTVTFLFTDLEGSTRLLEAHPRRYRDAVARHHALLRGAVEAHGGVVFETVGDAVYAAFADPGAAVAAALDGQRALRGEAWGTLGELRARMGLHTGAVEAQVGPGAHYFGAPLYRCARLTAAAHGGQVVLSEATAALTQEALPAGAGLRDLGPLRLKDLRRPKRVAQLVHPDLPAAFAPLTSPDAPPNNLPRQATSFVGRERELAEVARLLQTVPLLTLAGPGGIGKTRLALHAAAEGAGDYPDGVWLVELAGLADPELVPHAVATVLGVREEPGRPLPATLSDALRPKHLLLVLDNCEHLVAACATLADALLRVCPLARLLATSREPLGIAGETPWRVPPLSLPEPPDARASGSVEAPGRSESVRLFVERAATAQPGFSLTERNARAVADVCRWLDGIPLALELAAARLTVLSPEGLLGRLEDRFRLLTGGSRTALPRQQTLRATVEWSYGLLPEPERALFDRLAVFSGGWTLEGAEVVGAGPEVAAAEVLDLLARLVDKSLVLAEEGRGGGVRYRLLETLRRYGRERLDARGETEGVRQQHAAFFEDFGRELAPSGPQQADRLDRLEAEHDNLRAALRWAVDRDRAARGLRLANALGEFWRLRGYLSEGRAWLHALLTLPSAPTAGPARAQGLRALAALARRQGDYEAARALLEERLALARAEDDRPALAHCLTELGQVTCQQGDYTAARRLLEEGLAVAVAAADRAGTAGARRILGQVALRQGEHERARALLEETLALFEAGGDRLLVAYCLCDLGDVALEQGDHGGARARFTESQQLAREFGDRTLLAYVLENFAYLAAAEAQADRALRLAGAADVLRERLGAPLPPDFRALSVRWLEPARRALGEDAQAVAWALGRTMPLDRALAYALNEAADALS